MPADKSGHPGPASLQAAATVVTHYRSQAPCRGAQQEHVQGLQLLLALKQMCNSVRSRITAEGDCAAAPPRQASPADGAPACPQERGKKSVRASAHPYTCSSKELRKHLLVPALFFLNSKMLEGILCSSTTFSQCCKAVVTPLFGCWLLLSPPSLCPPSLVLISTAIPALI